MGRPERLELASLGENNLVELEAGDDDPSLLGQAFVDPQLVHTTAGKGNVVSLAAKLAATPPGRSPLGLLHDRLGQPWAAQSRNRIRASRQIIRTCATCTPSRSSLPTSSELGGGLVPEETFYGRIGRRRRNVRQAEDPRVEPGSRECRHCRACRRRGDSRRLCRDRRHSACHRRQA